MTAERKLESKIGAFVLIGALILVIMIFSIKDVRSFFRPRQELQIVFEHVSGIKNGSPVRLAGIEVGEVKNIRLFYNETLGRSQVAVTASLDQQVQVREDFEAYIGSLGLVGEKYIEIMPGSQRAPLLGKKDRLIGYVPPSMEEVAESGQLLMEQLRQLTGSLNQVIGDENMRNRLKGTVANSEELTAEMRKLVQTSNRILERVDAGEGTLGRLLTDDTLYEDVREMVADLKKHPWKLLIRTPESKRDERPAAEKEKPGPGKAGGSYLYRRLDLGGAGQ